MTKPGFWRTWWVALRPFSFPASAMSVLFGTALAVTAGGARLDALRLLLALAGMVLLHGAANVLNDVYDFRKGLDRQVYPVSGAVVRGWLAPRAALRGALILFAAGAALGLLLAWLVGWPILAIGVGGLVVGVFYSAGPGLKYRALGDLCVFLDFGILGALGAWTVQTGAPSALPALWAVPLSLLVIAILHANNWRDIAGDNGQGCATVASLLGDRASAAYYRFLMLAPFGLVLLYIVLPRLTGGLPAMPPAFLVTLLALPLALRLLGRARRRAAPARPLDFVALDGATAGLNLLFGALCTAAPLLDRLAARVL